MQRFSIASIYGVWLSVLVVLFYSVPRLRAVTVTLLGATARAGNRHAACFSGYCLRQHMVRASAR
jgi:hypothetical protein